MKATSWAVVHAEPAFDELVKLAMYGIDKTEITLGGVKFWFDRGILNSSKPKNKWDVAKIVDELVKGAEIGYERAKNALKA